MRNQAQFYLTLWKELKRAVPRGQAVDFKQDQVVLYKGHVPCGIYVCPDGTIRFNTASGCCKVKKVTMATPQGTVLGLHHFVRNIPFCCTCFAAENCALIFIPRPVLVGALPRPWQEILLGMWDGGRARCPLASRETAASPD